MATTARTIRSAEVLQAQRALLLAIDARVKAGGLLREQAEAQVSGLLSDIWTEAERTLRRLPGRVFLDPTQEKCSAWFLPFWRKGKMGEYVQVTKTGSVAPGTAECVDVRGIPIALFNIEGQFYAIGNTCTHRGGPLAEGLIEGDEVICPWHGARYKIPTSEVLSPPAPAGVPKYNVRVQGEDLEIEI